ncbi:MAG: response regulator transcription factor [Pseudomonadota bacterium]
MHILLVDDHQLFSAGLSILIREIAPEAVVRVANNVQKAISDPQPFELILLDLHLPDASGFEGLDRLKAAYDASAIVVVSSEEDPRRIRECVQRGAMGFVPKSSSTQELFNAMRLILEGKTYLPPGCMAADLSQPASPGGEKVQLSRRQHEVLMKVVQGKPNKVIARELGISDQTVKSHVMAVMGALGVNNRTEAVYKAAAIGIAWPAPSANGIAEGARLNTSSY